MATVTAILSQPGKIARTLQQFKDSFDVEERGHQEIVRAWDDLRNQYDSEREKAAAAGIRLPTVLQWLKQEARDLDASLLWKFSRLQHSDHVARLKAPIRKSLDKITSHLRVTIWELYLTFGEGIMCRDAVGELKRLLRHVPTASIGDIESACEAARLQRQASRRVRGPRHSAFTHGDVVSAAAALRKTQSDETEEAATDARANTEDRRRRCLGTPERGRAAAAAAAVQDLAEGSPMSSGEPSSPPHSPTADLDVDFDDESLFVPDALDTGFHPFSESAKSPSYSRGPLQESNPNAEIILQTHGQVFYHSDLEILEKEAWINDTIINFYSKYLLTQHTSTSNVQIQSTYFYSNLTRGCRKGINYHNVHRWDKSRGLFTYKHLLVPISQNSHWYLVVLLHLNKLLQHTTTILQGDNNPSCQPSLAILDSMLDTIDYSPVCENLLAYIAAAAGNARLELMENYQQTQIIKLAVPQQSDINNCGVFMMENMERFVRLQEQLCTNSEHQLPCDVVQKRKVIRDLIWSFKPPSEDGTFLDGTSSTKELCLHRMDGDDENAFQKPTLRSTENTVLEEQASQILCLMKQDPPIQASSPRRQNSQIQIVNVQREDPRPVSHGAVLGKSQALLEIPSGNGSTSRVSKCTEINNVSGSSAYAKEIEGFAGKGNLETDVKSMLDTTLCDTPTRAVCVTATEVLGLLQWLDLDGIRLLPNSDLEVPRVDIPRKLWNIIAVSANGLCDFSDLVADRPVWDVEKMTDPFDTPCGFLKRRREEDERLSRYIERQSRWIDESKDILGGVEKLLLILGMLLEHVALTEQTQAAAITTEEAALAMEQRCHEKLRTDPDFAHHIKWQTDSALRISHLQQILEVLSSKSIKLKLLRDTLHKVDQSLKLFATNLRDKCSKAVEFLRDAQSMEDEYDTKREAKRRLKLSKN